MKKTKEQLFTIEEVTIKIVAITKAVIITIVITIRVVNFQVELDRLTIVSIIITTITVITTTSIIRRVIVKSLEQLATKRDGYFKGSFKVNLDWEFPNQQHWLRTHYYSSFVCLDWIITITVTTNLLQTDYFDFQTYLKGKTVEQGMIQQEVEEIQGTFDY